MDDNELVDALFAAGRDIGSLPTHVCAEAAERLQEVCNLVRQLRMENAAADEDLNKTRGRLDAAGRSLSNWKAAYRADTARLEQEKAALELLRPHWAKGYSSDGIAAQCSVDALNALWCALGVNDQTGALERIAKIRGPGDAGD